MRRLSIERRILRAGWWEGNKEDRGLWGGCAQHEERCKRAQRWQSSNRNRRLSPSTTSRQASERWSRGALGRLKLRLPSAEERGWWQRRPASPRGGRCQRRKAEVWRRLRGKQRGRAGLSVLEDEDEDGGCRLDGSTTRVVMLVQRMLAESASRLAWQMVGREG